MYSLPSGFLFRALSLFCSPYLSIRDINTLQFGTVTSPHSCISVSVNFSIALCPMALVILAAPLVWFWPWYAILETSNIAWEILKWNKITKEQTVSNSLSFICFSNEKDNFELNTGITCCEMGHDYFAETEIFLALKYKQAQHRSIW